MIKAQPGKQYAIRIRTANGRTYESDPEIMPYPVKPDTAYTEMENVKLPNSAGDPVIDSWQIDLYINTPVQSAKSYAFLRWRVLEAYNFMEYNNNTPLAHPKTCYMTNDINYQDIQLYNGQELKGGELEHHLILTRLAEPDVQFYLAHYYNISQYSITREAYDYWSKLKSVSNPSGSFLDTPPAAVIGNVHNITNKDEVVLGNFEVAAVNIIRVKGRPADLLPHYVHYPCSDIPRPTYCYDCLTLPNSSLVEPSYW